MFAIRISPVLPLVFAISLCVPAPAVETELIYFEQHVRPLLAKRCYKCHSEQSEEVGGNLLLDSRDGWIRGGDLGSPIRIGDPAASLLIKAIRHTSDELQMPPDARLTDHEISILERWIRTGAIDPRRSHGATNSTGVDLVTGRQFWSFQPIVRKAITVPAVRDRAWARNELDLFVLERLERQGLRPSPPANRRVLLRRVTFDLTGLPPTPAEVEAFVNDNSPAAYDKVVNRLLASARYGQRWGRFWLDVARYADSNGLDENIAHGNAWRYRDYVIEALNNDKPYDQFVVEQLAGDLLPQTSDERVRHARAIATGFLCLGPKVLAEVDESKMEMDIIDEQVDTVGRAFMALTLGCARCHDHKFDPIRTADYYALAGIFKSTKTMEHFKKIARWHEISIPTKVQQQEQAAHEARVVESKREIEDLTEAAVAALQQRLGPCESLPEDVAAHFDDATRKQLSRLKAALEQLEAAAPELPSAMAVVDYHQPTDLHVHIRGSHLTQGALVPRGFPAVLVAAESAQHRIAAGESGRLQLAQWLVDPSHPLLARVMVNRVWRWHFGRGLVASTDNFGHLGSRPTNPPLLDWLAMRFVDDQWSIKNLHRIIVLSSTYRMGSALDHNNAAIDPENRFQWRFNVRRLEAAAIRDALLAVSGQLDESMGGSLLHVKNREFLFDHTSKDETDYNSQRRSVYLPVIRNHLYDVFELFDYGDASVSSSNRSETTVAPQALFVMNSDLVNSAAGAMADRVLQVSRDTRSEPLEVAYMIAYGRLPDAQEVARDTGYLRQFAEHAERFRPQASSPSWFAWRMLCHTMIASNEFIHVR